MLLPTTFFWISSVSGQRIPVMKPEIAYVSDPEVDAATDLAIRNHLTACFTKDGDEVFRRRRYWKEPYPL